MSSGRFAMQNISHQLRQAAILDEDEEDTGLCKVATECMNEIRSNYDRVVEEVGLSCFYDSIYPQQAELAISYICEAFRKLDCDLSETSPGQSLPEVWCAPKHAKVVKQTYATLEQAGLIRKIGDRWIRMLIETPKRPTKDLLMDLVRQYPQHATEHVLVHVTASKLAECLTGEAEASKLLFSEPGTLALLEDYYTNTPYLQAGTLALADYLAQVVQKANLRRPVRILELGAGTGGTTSYLFSKLASTGCNFEYIFSDISTSSVTSARKKFAPCEFMRYAVLDVEKSPQPGMEGKFDLVISKNYIHATTNVQAATSNVRKMLRSDGILCLLEMTRKLPWFDLVFGLLEGRWLFDDGREYALLSEHSWESVLRASKFRWIDWTAGQTEESRLLKMIVASPSPDLMQVKQISVTNGRSVPLRTKETVIYKRVDGLDLEADIYYPREAQSVSAKPRPVALMIHGGGHMMLSRKDIRPQQTAHLLKSGFLPISIDYRLCPETTLTEGPMIDVRDALAWIRNALTSLALGRKDVKVDASRVVAVGWSSGGHLAMTLGWTARQIGIAPPDAILEFYCPTDYRDPFYTSRNIPRGSKRAVDRLPESPADFRDAIHDKSVVAYNPSRKNSTPGDMMAWEDPRSQIVLWTNYRGSHMRVLLNGMKKGDKDLDSLPGPTKEQVKLVSPLYWIENDSYTTPMFCIHGTADDLVPTRQAHAVFDALSSRGIESEIRIVEGGVHLFDCVPGWQEVPEHAKAVWDGYEFLRRQVGL